MMASVRGTLKRHPEVDALRGGGFTVHAEADSGGEEVLLSVALPDGMWSYVVLRHGYLIASAKAMTKRAAREGVARVGTDRPPFSRRLLRVSGMIARPRAPRWARGARRLEGIEAELAEHMRINRRLVGALARVQLKLQSAEGKLRPSRGLAKLREDAAG